MTDIAAGLDFSERPDGPLGAEAGVAAVLALLETASEDGASDRDVILAAWAAEYFATMISAHNRS